MSNRNDNDRLFDELVKRHESDTLDFKRDLYDFSIADGRDAFIKDVICMANTPRDEAAYIVCGIDYKPETGAVLFGLNRQEDGAKLIDQVNEKNVRPRPTIHYIPVCQDGKLFGIIEIPVQREYGRPFLPAREMTGMNRDDVLLRRDSQNAKANSDDLMRLFRWFSGGTPVAGAEMDKSGDWETFLDSVCRFEDGRYFMLIADRVDEASPESHAGLGLAPWVTVTDFDPQSEGAGLLAAVRANLEQRRSLQLVVKGQKQPIYPHGGTTWFFARGLFGRETTLSTGPYRAWLREYGRPMSDWIRATNRMSDL